MCHFWVFFMFCVSLFSVACPLAFAGGAIDVTTGQYFPDAGGGVIDPRNGTFYTDVGGGYVNSRTGQFSPKAGGVSPTMVTPPPARVTPPPPIRLSSNVVVQGNGLGKPYTKTVSTSRGPISGKTIKHKITIFPHKEIRKPKPRVIQYEIYDQSDSYENECGNKSLVTVQDEKGFVVDSYCE